MAALDPRPILPAVICSLQNSAVKDKMRIIRKHLEITCRELKAGRSKSAGMNGGENK